MKKVLERFISSPLVLTIEKIALILGFMSFFVANGLTLVDRIVKARESKIQEERVQDFEPCNTFTQPELK